jgi:hypothetical protein
MACEEEDFDIPIVDPAEIGVIGERKVIPFSVSQMVTMGEMRSVKESFEKLVQCLNDREGTIVDVTEDILGYHDQVSLTEARQIHEEIECHHVGAAVRGEASWPTLIRVESWLRDGIQMEDVPRNRAAAIRLWCLSMAVVAGPESVRKVVEATTEWVKYDLRDAQCSGGGSDMIARVAWKRAMLYSDWLWTGVMFAVDRASSDVLWDWRRTDRACYTHACARCPNGLGGKNGMDEMPHHSMMAGGYSGNDESLANVQCGCGCGSLNGCTLESEIEDEALGEELIDFSAQ